MSGIDIEFKLNPLTKYGCCILNNIDRTYFGVKTGHYWGGNDIVTRIFKFRISNWKREEAVEPVSCKLTYKVRIVFKNDDRPSVDAPEPLVKENMLDENEAKNIIITSLIHAACVKEHKYLIDDGIDGNDRRFILYENELNNYYEGHSSLRLEDIDMRFFTKDQLVTICPPTFNYIAQSDWAKMIEIIALCYRIKGLPKELFIEKFKDALGNRAEKYWNKVVGENRDAFLDNAVKDAERELEKLYRQKRAPWMLLIDELEKNIKDIDAVIQEKFNEFHETVIGPLVQQQRDLIYELRRKKKEPLEQELKRAMKQAKDELHPDVQKRVSIQKYLGFKRQTVNLKYRYLAESNDPETI